MIDADEMLAGLRSMLRKTCGSCMYYFAFARPPQKDACIVSHKHVEPDESCARWEMA